MLKSRFAVGPFDGPVRVFLPLMKPKVCNKTNGPTGEYSVVVTNADGCTATASISVTNTHCNSTGRYLAKMAMAKTIHSIFVTSKLKRLKFLIADGLQVYHANDYLSEWHGQSDKGTLPNWY